MHERGVLLRDRIRIIRWFSGFSVCRIITSNHNYYHDEWSALARQHAQTRHDLNLYTAARHGASHLGAITWQRQTPCHDSPIVIAMSKPTANWEKVGDRFYRKVQLYTAVFDQDLELDKYNVVGAPYSGAVGGYATMLCVRLHTMLRLYCSHLPR